MMVAFIANISVDSKIGMTRLAPSKKNPLMLTARAGNENSITISGCRYSCSTTHVSK